MDKENLQPMNIEELIQLWPQFKDKKENQNGVFFLTSGSSGGVIGFPDSLIASRVLFAGDTPLLENIEKREVPTPSSPNLTFIILNGQEAANRAIMKTMLQYEICNIEVFSGDVYCKNPDV